MMTREKNIILAARVISILFTPFYLPMVGLMALFAFSYLALMPWAYKLQVLIMVYVFTILLPTLLIHLYRRYRGWNLIELGHKERRLVPYVISIFCYFFCVYLMEALHIPHFMGTIVSAIRPLSVVWQVPSSCSGSSLRSIPCGGSLWCSSWQACWAPAA